MVLEGRFPGATNKRLRHKALHSLTSSGLSTFFVPHNPSKKYL